MFKTPVVFICFNRPSLTRITFHQIRKLKPTKLFLIMDAPNLGNNSDKKKCAEVKKIISQIDWKCKVYRNFSKNNLGLKKRITSGLTWVFKKVDKAIILEDDCYPSKNFFYFCETMLRLYKNNMRISIVTGNNFQSKPINKDSYYFSKYSHIWGWATWKRSWDLFDDNEKKIEKFLVSKKFKNICKTRDEQNYWISMHNQIKKGKLKSWAYYFLLSIWKNNGLTITPNFNLIKNLGFDSNLSTNQHDLNLKTALLKNKLEAPLKHPKFIKLNERADNQVFYSVYKKNIIVRLTNKIKKIMNFLVN